jgi:aminopeptidase N
VHRAEWALNQTIRGIRYFEDLFEIPYTFSKLDSIAVPFRGGAMENWVRDVIFMLHVLTSVDRV